MCSTTSSPLGSTVTPLFKEISENISSTFENLIKLVLEKNLRPVLQPLKEDIKTVYNVTIGQDVRVYIPFNPDQNINNYYYRPTQKCIGWTSDFITTFGAKGKFTKNNFPKRHPSSTNIVFDQTQVAYDDKGYRLNSISNVLVYNSISELVSVIINNNTNMLDVVSNNRAHYEYVCNVSYTSIHNFLALIGEDIIDQTNIALPPQVSLRLSTALLRSSLEKLELSLEALTETQMNNYIDMIQLVNTLFQNQIPVFISFVSRLEYTDFNSMTAQQKNYFTNSLGSNFINAFLCNPLVVQLLNEKSSNYLIISCYMFSLCKMLFYVFGYDTTGTTQTNSNVRYSERLSILKGQFDEKSSAKICSVDFVSIFCEAYPKICEIIGNCKYTCPTDVDCTKIPATYTDLTTINEMLWRFNSYAYCRYLDVVYSKRVQGLTQRKIQTRNDQLNGI